MKTSLTLISRQTRVAGFVFAALMSAAVLGSTVFGMQAGRSDTALQVVSLERIVITAPAVN